MMRECAWNPMRAARNQFLTAFGIVLQKIPVLREENSSEEGLI
jgi:hypothetical protein